MHSAQSETAPLVRVLLKHPREAFVDEATIAWQWRPLHFTEPPDLPRAIDEFERFAALLASAGATIDLLPRASGTTLDSIYVRDAAVVCDRGAILCRMGKEARAGEPDAQAAGFDSLAVPVIGRIEAPGLLEGGDVAWLDARTLAVGRGYRTNDAGIRQLRHLLGDSVDDLIVVPLPHWRGRTDVMHLMSLISPLAPSLAVVYSPLLPVPFREQLLERGCRLVEVPEAEFDSMGTNVLALSPTQCLMVEGNPRTREAIERAGVEVLVYQGREISVKGAGGPTCLTRPLQRAIEA